MITHTDMHTDGRTDTPTHARTHTHTNNTHEHTRAQHTHTISTHAHTRAFDGKNAVQYFVDKINMVRRIFFYLVFVRHNSQTDCNTHINSVICVVHFR